MVDYSFVIPTYNNAKDLAHICGAIQAVFDANSYEIIIVDDGSTDETWQTLQSLSQKFKCVKALRLSMNFGQHPATLCGIEYAKGKYIITLDDDREIHPVEALKLIECQKSTGASVVYGTFKSNDKLLIATLKKGYRALSRLNGKNRGKGSSFRLINRELAQAMVKANHHFSFIDELILWYTNAIFFVPVVRSDNSSSISRYKLPRLLLTTLNLMLFSSEIPLRLVTFFGTCLASINFAFGVFIMYKKYFNKIEVDGYTSLIVSILFSTGVIITGIGVIALYLRHLLLKINQKPIYHVAEEVC